MDRFWCKVDKSGGPDACWLWQASVVKDYGQCRVGAERRAHRAAYALTHGTIPEGAQVLHSCDTPTCCNPAHLFLGTQLDNMRDKVTKRRQARGERHGKSKLTDEQTAEIRRLYPAYTHRQLGEMFGVSHTNIGDILRGRIRKP